MKALFGFILLLIAGCVLLFGVPMMGNLTLWIGIVGAVLAVVGLWGMIKMIAQLGQN